MGPYLLSGTHEPAQNKLGVIRTLNHGAENVLSRDEGREVKREHTQQCHFKPGDPLKQRLSGAVKNPLNCLRQISETTWMDENIRTFVLK